jgi:hypothetical protein
MGDVTALRLGPGSATFGGVDLGFVAFDTPIEIEDESKGVGLKAGQTGDTDLDFVLTGHNVTVKVPVVEVSPSKLAMAIPNAVVSGSTITVKLRTGLSVRSLAQELVVTRIVDGIPSTDPDDIVTFPLASAAPGRVTRQFNPNKQEEFTITFRVWPDPVTGEFYTTGG